MALLQSAETKNGWVVMGEVGMKVCESTRESSKVRTEGWSVLITKNMNGSSQTGKCWGMSYSFTSWPEGLCSLSKTTRMSHVPCFLLLSHQEDKDTQKAESWTTDSNLAGDFWTMQLSRMKWGSGIHCSSFSIGLWIKFWTASTWEWLFQFICSEAFLPSCITCSVFSWNETQTKPACHLNCSAGESLTHSTALSKQLAHSLSQLCLLKSRAMSYTLLIMKKWTWMELFPESKLLNKYALTSDPKMRTCLWEQLHFH